MMKRFLVLGAGKSSAYLIERLDDYVADRGGALTVADVNASLAVSRCKSLRVAKAVALAGSEPEAREALVREHDVVISLLPPDAHVGVARQCLTFGRHLVTASYVSEAMQALHDEAKAAGLIFLNECGLDPGIDHISAMVLLDELRRRNVHVLAFRSACGGLVAPESDTNPWGYKLSWNPRNVVLAGQGGSAVYLEGGLPRLCPPHRLFALAYDIHLPGVGDFELYANRDSLSYLPLYGLEGVRDFIRGTLRRRPFCKAWQALVMAGFTDNSAALPHLAGKPRRLLAQALGIENVEQLLVLAAEATEEVKRALEFLDLFSDIPLSFVHSPTAAGYLQHILEEKWRLESSDKDRVVLVHQIDFEEKGARRRLTSVLVEDGCDATHTAMARTVGLPLAEASILVAEERIPERGVLRPLLPSVYRPLWQTLTMHHGLRFTDHEERL